MHVHIHWVTVTIDNFVYHCMSRLVYISMCIFRCFVHSRCRYRVLSNIWFNKCVMVLHERMFRRIPRLCRTHEGMRYHVEHCLGDTHIWPTGVMYSENRIHLSSMSSIHREGATKYGGMICTYLNCHTTLFDRCMTVDGPHLIWPKNKEITSNSLNARCSPYSIQHTTSDINLFKRLRYVDTGNAFPDFQR